MKGIKTTIIGIIAILGLCYKIYLSGGIEVVDFLLLITSVGFLATKDYDKSHSKKVKDMPPPDLEEHNPAKKYKENDHVLHDGKEWIADVNNGPGEFNPIHWICLT